MGLGEIQLGVAQQVGLTEQEARGRGRAVLFLGELGHHFHGAQGVVDAAGGLDEARLLVPRLEGRAHLAQGDGELGHLVQLGDELGAVAGGAQDADQLLANR